MRHIFQQGTDPNAPVLVLFHGTGGTEQDLLPLAQAISPTSSVLSVRGNVLENGMPRFFRRLAEGVFDEEDLIFRTKELYDFLDQAAVEYGFDGDNSSPSVIPTARISRAACCSITPNALQGAILHHPMVPLRGIATAGSLGYAGIHRRGKNDPICSPQETEELSGLLSEAGADVPCIGRSRPPVDAVGGYAAAEWLQGHLALTA